MSVQEFIKLYTPHANRVAIAYGVPSLVTLAQAAWESGWGKHSPKYNFFGMTGAYNGNYQLLWTSEFVKGKKVRVQRKFRAYDSPTTAFTDYAKNLQRNFPDAFAYKRGNPEMFLKKVFEGGYATDPDYLTNTLLIMKMIKKYVS